MASPKWEMRWRVNPTESSGAPSRDVVGSMFQCIELFMRSSRDRYRIDGGREPHVYSLGEEIDGSP